MSLETEELRNLLQQLTSRVDWLEKVIRTTGDSPPKPQASGSRTAQSARFRYSRRLDFGQLVTLAVGTCATIWGLNEELRSSGPKSWLILSVGGGAMFLAWFLDRGSNTMKDPQDLHVLRGIERTQKPLKSFEKFLRVLAEVGPVRVVLGGIAIPAGIKGLTKLENHGDNTQAYVVLGVAVGLFVLFAAPNT
jgi:hypothetical protein